MSTDYQTLMAQMKAFIETEPDFISVMSNASALLMQAMEGVNWAGFYLVKARNGRQPVSSLNDQVLKVGPFQGKPACVLIERGKGVCGTAWEGDRTIVVPDVHAFPGHIACDSASRSEIVIPIHDQNKVVAVLDIDSPAKDRFSKEDRQGLEQFAGLLEEAVYHHKED